MHVFLQNPLGVFSIRNFNLGLCGLALVHCAHKILSFSCRKPVKVRRGTVI